MTDTRIEELLAEFHASRERGEPLTVAQLLASYPSDAAMLRPLLHELLGLDALLPASDLPAAIGAYRVERRLGRGATGEVFAVVDRDGRSLALKRLLPHVGALVRARQRLQREASVLRELHHPGIVEVVDIGDDRGTPFVVMARIDGRSLAGLIADARGGDREQAFAVLAGPGSRWQRIARCVAAIADAVAAAHQHGVLHRDLKPANVLLRANGQPVLVDFGLAVDSAAGTLTGTGDVLGTPHYMAPEQARGRVVDVQSDVYGLGAILYEMLTLTPPRHGSDPLQVLVQARSVPPAPPRHLARDVPRELDLITRRAMAFRSRQRYPGAADLAQALESVAEGGRPVGPTLSLGARIEELCRRRRRTLQALGALAVMLAIGSLVVDLRSTARVERLRRALLAAASCQLDGDRAALTRAAAEVAALGDPVLAAWFDARDQGDRRERADRPIPGAAGGDPFVAALIEGQQAMPAQPEAAVAAFARAVRLRPDAPIAGAWLGIAAAAAKDHELAERELTAATRALPDCVRVHVELAKVLRARDRLEPAVAIAERAASLPRASAETWHELAKVRSYAKDGDGALRAIEHAIELTGDRPSVSMLRTKSVVLASVGRHAEALPVLERITRLVPSANVWTSYGAMLDHEHRMLEAVAAYRQALVIDRRHAPALVNLAYLHSGSNSECEDCRAFFAANPGQLDAALVERYALDLLVAQEGSYDSIEQVAAYVRRVGGSALFAAAVDDRLRRDLPAPALGRLTRARNALRRE